MDLKLNFTPLEMTGFMHLDLPKDVFINLKSQCLELLNNNFSTGKKSNEFLYSAIENEYHLPDHSKLEKFLQVISPHYFSFFYKKPAPTKLKDVWINYQKKYEHNPFHNHFFDLSFVIWIQIPYNLEEEKKVKNIINSNNFQEETTAFTFWYGSNFSNNFCGIGKHTLQLDKSFEGKMILFNSKLPHSVYPFYTSDDYRISIAGNLSIEKSEN